MPVVKISMLEGRSAAEKRALIAAVTGAVTSTLAIEPARVRVLISELPAENWGVGGVAKDRQ